MNRPRRVATKQPSPADDTDGARNLDVADDAPRKSTNHARRTHKSRAGLEKLVDMPLDFIWLLVFKLQPLDLLRLAATCKTLRGFFMSRNSVEYWKVAAQNVEDLPPPPERLSWPAYTAFMFSPICQGCGKGGCDNMLWNCFARYCKPCQREVLLYTSRYDDVLNLEAAFPGVHIAYPWNQLSLSYVVPHIPGEGHYQIAIDRLRRALERMSPEEAFRFIEAEAAALRSAEELAWHLKRWKRESEATRAAHLEQVREQRCKSIKEKLIELGWGNELKRMKQQTLSSHRLVAQSKPLTERIWQNIQDELVAFMVDHQQDRLYKQHGKVVKERLLTMLKVAEAIHSFDLPGPSPHQVAIAIPEVQQILRLPGDAVVTEDNFAFLSTVLPAFVTQWKKTATTHLADLINAKLELPEAVDPLSLAVASMFTCKYCRMSLRYPRLLTHTCTGHPKTTYEERRNYSKELVGKTFPDRHCTGASFQDEIKLLQKLIELHGLDAKTTTREQLDSSDMRLTCVRHKQDGAVRVMSWSQMFDHYKNETWTWCPYDDIQAIPQEQRDLAKSLEQAAWDRRERKMENKSIWQCKHCTKSTASPKAAILEHLMSEHQIDSPGEHDLQRSCQYDEPLEVVVLLDEDKREELELDGQYKTEIEAGIAAFVNLR
ncbi:hypothetical protein PsYK624_029150 [Phanerochaete sordida]|uniref:F-box domain-containing protein n=1 Tax=Phanerochaete sordida TaxID=48140 RepID=A0A9P3LAI9_9APHY|nr:hypothetical protein PsYK624_029150 [Phanerochaete sordida]